MSRRRWPLFVFLAAAPVLAQNAPASRTGNRGAGDNPFPPHKIIGNLYYVGSDEHCSFLIATPAGNILINTGYEAAVPMIRAAVEKLGFRFTDIKIVLGSHAHADHMQGDALVKELTAARVMAMEQDIPALEKMRPGNKPHPIDRILHDRDEVELGGTKLVAYLTPGHTKGCTSWTLTAQENGKSYNVVIVCGMGANTGQALVNNQDYPQIADDYARGFKTLRALPCDVFLGSHTGHYGMQEKYGRLQSGGPNPFIDPAGYQAHLDLYESAFHTKLKEDLQRVQAGPR